MFFSNSESTGVSPRTLLIWFAALVVTWVSGIEPTWRKVQDVAISFEKVNWQQQEADRNTIVEQQKIEGRRAWLPQLNLFKKDYPAGKKREDERDALYKALNEALLKSQEDVRNHATIFPLYSISSDTEPARPCDSQLLSDPGKIPSGNTEAEKNLASAIDLLRNFCVLEKGLDQLSLENEEIRSGKQAEIIKAGEAARQEAFTKARAQSSQVRKDADVNFELLGLKFKAAPLFASFLWSALAFAWLLATRAEASKSQIVPDVAGGEIPKSSNRDIGLLALLVLSVWAMQLRVSWVGLSITALQGQMKWKAFVAVALCLLVLASAFVAAIVLANLPSEKESAPTHRTGARKLVLSVMCLGVVVFAVVWWVPGYVVRLAQSALFPLPLISVLPILLVVLSWLWGQSHNSVKPEFTRRRRILLGSTSAVAVGFTGLIWWRMYLAARSTQDLSRREHSRKQSKRTTPTVSQRPGLEAGFYRTTETKVTEKAGRTVVHYVREGGRTISTMRHPYPRKMTKVDSPPPYYWLVSTEVPSLRGWDLSKMPRGKQQSLENYRVALGTASWSFEHAALFLLKNQGTGRANVLRACEILLNGIRHDVLFKQTHINLRKRSAPSYRLYDLAAGLAVRFNHPRVLSELNERIRIAGYELIFKSRMKKWEDSNSAWHQRWRHSRFPIKWQCDQEAVVF